MTWDPPTHSIDFTDAFDLARKALALGAEPIGRAVCPDKGCLIGWLMETPIGPIWRPEDKEFDPAAIHKIGPMKLAHTGRRGPYRECVGFALDHPDLDGIWGATNAATRARARARESTSSRSSTV
jgi:hypothetical protein